MDILSVALFFGYYLLLTVRGTFCSFPYAVCVVLFVFPLRSENGASPNQSHCSLPVTYKCQAVRALRASPHPPEGSAACVEDAPGLRPELAGGVRPRPNCSVAQSGTKGDDLSVTHLLSRGKLLAALVTTLLFSWWSGPRLHSCTVANLGLSSSSQASRRDWMCSGLDTALL